MSTCQIREEVVCAMVQNWNVDRPDPDQIGRFFAEDAVWHNISLKPVVGREALGDSFVDFSAQFARIH
ncbi:nuclear transport factor 2 family protein [Nocardia sp. R6R-6]|uniref:nuclear transport factor 2 family protein n=1 Tax=Nocardia sp. R6R-6 TaxID=3459303 RepID=UPI00403D8772